ncbi:hypothetical protein B0H13DRAFT_1918609 [Mycena leptocephala]|nr:hypothetical protein B0H13DRAFT_1918609 [Mycena leptocephala]
MPCCAGLEAWRLDSLSCWRYILLDKKWAQLVMNCLRSFNDDQYLLAQTPLLSYAQLQLYRLFGMASNNVSNAVILYTDRAVIEPQDSPVSEPHRNWALLLGSSLNLSPGRTLDQFYTSSGKILETHANRAAYGLGLGPHVVAQKIRSHFGKGEERVQHLDLLRSSIPDKLEKICWRLMEFTLPCDSSILQPTSCDEGGLSVIERLLIEHDSAGTLSICGALSIRYLNGILDLPGFWLDMGNVHSDVANKLCSEMVRILKDIGADILTLGPIDIDESDPPFDYDGVDLLATAVLTGLLSWFRKLDKEHYAQPWYDGFRKFLHILRGQVSCPNFFSEGRKEGCITAEVPIRNKQALPRGSIEEYLGRPRSSDLLPHAYAFATSSTFENILRTVYQEAQVNIAVPCIYEGELLENDGVVDEHLDSTYTTHMDIMASPEEDASYLVAIGIQESRKDARIIRGMMAHLTEQAQCYFDAIDMSINCGDKGIVFSEHAIDLCYAFETKMPVTNILKRMETEVSHVQKDVEKTLARFIDVREQLIRESERIPRQKDVLEREEQAARRTLATWGISERWATLIIEHSDSAKIAIATIGAVSRVGIILPVVIPVAIIPARIMAKGVKVVADFAIENRRKHIINYQDTILGLEDIEEKIALVIQSVNNFATWWQKMSSDLQDIKAQVISNGDIHEIVAQIRHQLVTLPRLFIKDQEAPGLLSGQL